MSPSKTQELWQIFNVTWKLYNACWNKPIFHITPHSTTMNFPHIHSETSNVWARILLWREIVFGFICSTCRWNEKCFMSNSDPAAWNKKSTWIKRFFLNNNQVELGGFKSLLGMTSQRPRKRVQYWQVPGPAHQVAQKIKTRTNSAGFIPCECSIVNVSNNWKNPSQTHYLLWSFQIKFRVSWNNRKPLEFT